MSSLVRKEMHAYYDATQHAPHLHAAQSNASKPTRREGDLKEGRLAGGSETAPKVVCQRCTHIRWGQQRPLLRQGALYRPVRSTKSCGWRQNRKKIIETAPSMWQGSSQTPSGTCIACQIYGLPVQAHKTQRALAQLRSPAPWPRSRAVTRRQTGRLTGQASSNRIINSKQTPSLWREGFKACKRGSTAHSKSHGTLLPSKRPPGPYWARAAPP